MSTIAAGLSVQIDAEDFAQMNRADQKTYARELIAQMEPALRKHIGDVRPKGQPFLILDGPVPDPSKSQILETPALVYIFTYSCHVEETDLPSDCTAYRARYGD